MVEVDAHTPLVGEQGQVPLVDVFEGRRQLLVYFHMWHDGKPAKDQCEGCTFFTGHARELSYLHSRSLEVLLGGREVGGYMCCLRDGDRVFETYWSTDRGTEAGATSYHLLDLTPYGRQETWEESPDGWPQAISIPPLILLCGLLPPR